jgi:hypothetical protein
MWIAIIVILAFVIIWPLLFCGMAMSIKCVCVYVCEKDIEDVWALFKKQNSPHYYKDGSIYFPSRRSLFFSVLPLVIFLPVLVIEALSYKILDSVIISLVLLSILWLYSSTGYTINNTHLLIRVAAYRWKLDLASIKSVKHSNNPISSPALSLKRLEIVTNDNNSILISPVEEEFFLKKLNEYVAIRID